MRPYPRTANIPIPAASSDRRTTNYNMAENNNTFELPEPEERVLHRASNDLVEWRRRTIVSIANKYLSQNIIDDPADPADPVFVTALNKIREVASTIESHTEMIVRVDYTSVDSQKVDPSSGCIKIVKDPITEKFTYWSVRVSFDGNAYTYPSHLESTPSIDECFVYALLDANEDFDTLERYYESSHVIVTEMPSAKWNDVYRKARVSHHSDMEIPLAWL